MMEIPYIDILEQRSPSVVSTVKLSKLSKSEGLTEGVLNSDPSSESESDIRAKSRDKRSRRMQNATQIKSVKNRAIKMVEDIKNFSWCRATGTDEDDGAFQTQIDDTIKKYSIYIKIGILALLGIVTVLLIIFTLGEMRNTKHGVNMINQLVSAFVYLFLCLVLSHMSTHLIPYILTLTILFFFYINAKITTGEDQYKFSEYYTTTIMIAYLMIVIMPSQWKINSLSFVAGLGYCYYEMFVKYGDQVPEDLKIIFIAASLYFTVTSLVLYLRLITLYGLVSKTEKLIDEMKKLLQVFPESVIIRTSEKNEVKRKKYFANRQFNTRICNIQNKILKINKIKCQISSQDDDLNQTKKFQVTLQSFLKQQEDKCNSNTLVE